MQFVDGQGEKKKKRGSFFFEIKQGNPLMSFWRLVQMRCCITKCAKRLEGCFWWMFCSTIQVFLVLKVLFCFHTLAKRPFSVDLESSRKPGKRFGAENEAGAAKNRRD